MEIFKDEAKQEQSIPQAIPVLPRLDRLDRLLQLLEEKHNLSGRDLTGSDFSKIRGKEDDGESKSLSSVLEEVREKGTLMDRINMLENRVMQLSLAMDERNSSRSSSSTTGHSNIVSDVQNVAGQGKDETVTCLDKQDSQEETESKGKKQRRSRSRKWSGWFRLGC